MRLLYLLFGVAAGIFLGAFEARTVIPKLKESTEALVWIILPIGIVLFALPWLFVTQIFGASEYTPFGIYAFFPFFVSVLGSSGWYFSKFEKENNVRLFVFVYGVRYWKEKNPGVGDRFYYFIRDLVSKDFYSLYLHVGYSKLYLQELSKKESIDSSTKQMLQQILDIMKKYRRVFLSIYVGFMIAMPLLVLWLFLLTSTNTFGMQQVVAHRIVSGREITIVLGVTPFVAVFGGIFGALLYARSRLEKAFLFCWQKPIMVSFRHSDSKKVRNSMTEKLNFLISACQKTYFQNEAQPIRFLTFSVLKPLCLFSLILDLIGLCLLGVCAL